MTIVSRTIGLSDEGCISKCSSILKAINDKLRKRGEF